MAMKTLIRILVAFAIVATALCLVYVASYADSPQFRWRRDLFRLKILGAVPNEGWIDIGRRMLPYRLGGTAFVDLDIVNPMTSAEDLEAGEQLYASECAACHGPSGEGFSGPALADHNFARRATNSYLFGTVARGLPGTHMPSFSLGASNILQLTTFVRHLADEAVADAAATSLCEACKSINVSFEHLTNAPGNPGNWITYSGAYNGQRFSTLRQIDHNNVSRLRLKWVHQMGRTTSGVQSVPIAVAGVLFLTGPDNEVLALNAATGETLWSFNRPVAETAVLCCGRNNRGVAALGNRIYHATLDNHVIALDMATGQPIWDTPAADVAEGYSMTAAPLAVRDKIIVGMAGGEFGVRGFLDAYNAESGERAWRFHTTPGPGEPGHETWENDAWRIGGGTTWVTGSYDPELNLLYWGTGNPAPLYDGEARPGDNLYTASVVALNPDTGELKWHFQFVPHDVNDWDAGLVPILADLEYQGAPRRLMLWANRNCFYYVLDRETGEFLQATEYCKQTWNDGFTREGRPIRRPNSTPTDEGNVIYPGPVGGSNWFSPAFSPLAHAYYVNHRVSDFVYQRIPGTFTRRQPFHGGLTKLTPGGQNTGAVTAISATSGEILWTMEKQRHSRVGILATAAGLVFTGNGEGVLLALDAVTGDVITRLPLGAPIDASPITYLHEGRQQLAVIAGGSLFVFEPAG